MCNNGGAYINENEKGGRRKGKGTDFQSYKPRVCAYGWTDGQFLQCNLAQLIGWLKFRGTVFRVAFS